MPMLLGEKKDRSSQVFEASELIRCVEIQIRVVTPHTHLRLAPGRITAPSFFFPPLPGLPPVGELAGGGEGADPPDSVTVMVAIPPPERVTVSVTTTELGSPLPDGDEAGDDDVGKKYFLRARKASKRRTRAIKRPRMRTSRLGRLFRSELEEGPSEEDDRVEVPASASER